MCRSGNHLIGLTHGSVLCKKNYLGEHKGSTPRWSKYCVLENENTAHWACVLENESAHSQQHGSHVRSMTTDMMCWLPCTLIWTRAFLNVPTLMQDCYSLRSFGNSAILVGCPINRPIFAYFIWFLDTLLPLFLACMNAMRGSTLTETCSDRLLVGFSVYWCRTCDYSYAGGRPGQAQQHTKHSI